MITNNTNKIHSSPCNSNELLNKELSVTIESVYTAFVVLLLDSNKVVSASVIHPYSLPLQKLSGDPFVQQFQSPFGLIRVEGNYQTSLL